MIHVNRQLGKLGRCPTRQKESTVTQLKTHRSQPATYLLVTFLLFIASLPGVPVFGQGIETEFSEVAAAKWLELRKNAFDSIAIAVETREKTIRVDSKSLEVERRERVSRQKQLTRVDFKYVESVAISDTAPPLKVPPYNRPYITVYNPKQTFSVLKDPENNWVLMGVERSPSDYIFDKGSIKWDWQNNKIKGPITTLTQALGLDPRLTIGMNRTIEGLVSGALNHDPSSLNFTLSSHDAFGRMVTVTISSNYDLDKLPRRPKSLPKTAVRMTVDGELTFLADWNWVPTSIDLTTREFDSDANELGKTIQAFHADYDKNQIGDAESLGKNLLPRTVKMLSKSGPNRNSTEIIYTIRSLSNSEIEAIEKTSTLSDFKMNRR